jgi:hypothetical protein
VPAIHYWATLETTWIEPAKPRLLDDFPFAPGALPRPEGIQEAHKRMALAALELALDDVDPAVPHPASPGLGEPAGVLAVRSFLESAAGYWFDEIALATPGVVGLWTPPPKVKAPAGDKRASGDQLRERPSGPRPATADATVDALIDGLRQTRGKPPPDWLLHPATNHSVAMGLRAYPSSQSPASDSATDESVRRFLAAAGLPPDLSAQTRDLKAEQLRLIANYVDLAKRAIVEEPAGRLSDDDLRGMFYGLNVALFDLVSLDDAGLAERLLPLLGHLVTRGHHGPFVPLIARALSLSFSKHEDFRQAEHAADVAFRLYQRAFADWALWRSGDSVEHVNLLEAHQQARLATSGLCLRRYEQEVIGYHYLPAQDRRQQYSRDRLGLARLGRLLERAQEHADIAVQLISDDIGHAGDGVPATKVWSRASTTAWHANARVMLLRAHLHRAHLAAVDRGQEAEVEAHLQRAREVSLQLTRCRLIQDHVNELVRFALQYAFLSRMRMLPVAPPGSTPEARAGLRLPELFYHPSEHWGIFDADAAARYLAEQNADAGVLVSLTHPGLRDALIRRSVPSDRSLWKDPVDPYRCWCESNRDARWLARKRDVDRAVEQLLRQPEQRLRVLPLYLLIRQAESAGP